MYVRTTRRKDLSGRYVEYVQLAQSYRDPITRKPKTHVVCPLGRKEELDLESIKRLISGLARLLPARDASEMETLALGGTELRFEGSRPMGGAYVLRQLWERIGIDRILASLIKEREIAFPVDWALFAMVANRALAPASKLAIEDWAERDVFLGKGGLGLKVHHFYRAMDLLLEHQGDLERQVFAKVAHLFNLEVDLVFFDKTSTYFEIEEADGFRAHGYSKDKRPDLPQVVIGLAVTKEGIPVKSWVFPGDTADVTYFPTTSCHLLSARSNK